MNDTADPSRVASTSKTTSDAQQVSDAAEVHDVTVKLAIQFQKVKTYHKDAVEGQPIWAYIREIYPYGYPDRALAEIFSRALTINPEDPKKQNCTIAETIDRLGFSPKDQSHVIQTFEIAFHALVASELITGGSWSLSGDVKYVQPYNMFRTRDVLKTHPVIKLWMEPSPSYYRGLRHVLLRNAKVSMQEIAQQQDVSPNTSEIRGHPQRQSINEPQVDRTIAAIRLLQKTGENQHQALVSFAIAAVMQQFLDNANRTWLQTSKHPLGNVESLWEELRKRCKKDTSLLDRAQGVAQGKSHSLPS